LTGLARQIVGTTKLTRKEILGEDPVHHAMVHSIQVVRSQRKTIALALASLALVSLGTYLALQYLEKKEMTAQQQLARAMDFYHAHIDPSALDDPYGKGPDPVFRNNEARDRAASKEFSSIIERHGSSKVALIARYYLGLCQMRLGEKDAALKSLEAVRNNTKDRTIGYLGKKVLAKYLMGEGNYKGALEILEGMIQDPQCELPKEELKLEVARAYLAQGKRAEAAKILREARDDSSRSALQPILSQELSRIEGVSGVRPDSLTTISPRP